MSFHHYLFLAAMDSKDNKEEQTVFADAVGVGSKRKVQGGLSKPSKVLLLKNMVGPNDVDSTLAEETKAECMRFGPVSNCIIYEVNAQRAPLAKPCPDEESVRMFVAFEKQESAVKAFKDLNGRFFGGRKIAARFYDEIKFQHRDLAPDIDEW